MKIIRCLSLVLWWCWAIAHNTATAKSGAVELLLLDDESTYPITVTKSGSGSGTVSSSPSGISCGSTCSASFSSGASITLTATATNGLFSGWSGDCSGTATTCTVTMAAAKYVTANFGPTTLTCSLASQNTVQKAYIGYYGRCADQSGMSYWCTRLDNSGGIIDPSFIAAFGTSAEYTSRFGRLSDPLLIDGLYQNMFSRSVEAAGLAFYQSLLNQRRQDWVTNHNGSINGATESALSRIALDILNGASGGDVVTLNGKVSACPKF